MSADEGTGKMGHKPIINLIKRAEGMTFRTRINAGMALGKKLGPLYFRIAH